MKERPILFSAPMVRAILDGTKTQTRRIIKPQPSIPLTSDDKTIDGRSSAQIAWDQIYEKCPYGQPGDRLWVRETFALTGDNASPIVHPEHGGVAWRATDNPKAFKWKPSIFMPRWASRITLEIEQVTVEQLQDISPTDSLREGVGHDSIGNPKVDFENLWRKINGPESWDANPLVWVISFYLITP